MWENIVSASNLTKLCVGAGGGEGRRGGELEEQLESLN